MLANWMFFWDSTAWTPAAPPAVDTPAGKSGGKGRKQYTGPAPDFWDVRARYLRRFLPKDDDAYPEPAPDARPAVVPALDRHDPGNVVSLDGARIAKQQMELAQAVDAAHAAQTRSALQAAVQLAQRVAFDLRSLEDDNRHRAIALLLLDSF